MKQSIYLNTVPREMIRTAMRAYRKDLTGLGQKMFDIAFNKMNKDAEIFELDGMEMIYIAQALNKYRKFLSSMNQKVEADYYKELAAEVEKIRINFQLKNGPKIYKEKAASAGTLTA